MGLMERFTGQPEPDERFGYLVANPSIARPLSFQLLFMRPIDLDADALTLALRSFHPSLDKAQAELLPVSLQEAPEGQQDSVIGLAGWEKHVVKLVGFASKIPDSVFENCVHDAAYSDKLKEDAKSHQSHILLYYAGYETDPLEQYVAMTVVAIALARFGGFGAILLLNEAARTSFPAEALLVKEPNMDALEALRQLPIPLLYGGFNRFRLAESPGVWMRTFGNVLLNLPDLAFLADSLERSSEVFDLFANLLSYLRESGKRFSPGDTVQVDDETCLCLRAPTEAEWYLQSDGEMLVLFTAESAKSA
jgi:hypothetical protein